MRMARRSVKKKLKLTRTRELDLLNRVLDALSAAGETNEALQNAATVISAATKLPFVAFQGEGLPAPPEFTATSECTVPMSAGGRELGILRLASAEELVFDASVKIWVARIASIAAGRLHQQRSQTDLHSLPGIDPLTSLPNLLLFRFLFQQALARARRGKEMMALLHFELDDFSNAQQSAGAEAVRQRVADIASRLKRNCRGVDTLACSGKDEFLWFISGLQKLEDVALIAEKALETVRYSSESPSFPMTTSIGISLFPYDGGEEGPLLKHAATALQRSRELGGNTYQFYTEMLNTRVVEQLAFRHRLREATRLNEFLLYFQPMVEAATQNIQGLEALIRWKDQDGKLLLPGEFLEATESVGLMDQVDAWVMARACEQVQSLQTADIGPLSISVNISHHIFRKMDFHWKISSILRETKLPPELLELDFPQTLLMEDPEYSNQMLQRIRALGVRLCMDDFGSGPLDLSQLKKFPLDTVKIDASAMRDLTSDSSGNDVLTAVISFAHGLKMRVVAEGVETAAQLQVLRSRGCDAFQGRMFCPPAGIERMRELLREKRVPAARDRSDTVEPLTIESSDRDWLEEELPSIREQPGTQSPSHPGVRGADVPSPVGKIYWITCYHCSSIFNAVDSKWCDCLVTERSLRCAHCGQCFCAAPVSYKIDFWREAPQMMWDRRAQEEMQDEDLPPNTAPDRVQRPLILVADDEIPVLAAARRALSGLGYGVVTAVHGEQALEMVGLYRPEVVLTDVMMPRVDGFELCRRIKSDPALASTRVIIMTSRTLGVKDREAVLFNYQPDEILQKPLSLAVLRSLLSSG
jgi:diguanylate cyclase (GGDEF)-like protein